MDTIIRAFFNKQADLDLAATALRNHGVIDLRIYSLIEEIGAAEKFTCAIDVFVEKSRWRQAEDTLIRHGGKLSIVPTNPVTA